MSNLEDEPRYRCCCNRLHVTIGAKVIAVLEAIGVAGGIISCIVNGGWIATIITSILWIAAIICLFKALRSENRLYTIPHIILQVLEIIAIGLLIIAVIIICSVGYADSLFGYPRRESVFNLGSRAAYLKVEENFKAICAVLIIFLLASEAVAIWFLLVVFKCFQYFRDCEIRKSYRKALLSEVQESNLQSMKTSGRE